MKSLYISLLLLFGSNLASAAMSAQDWATLGQPSAASSHLVSQSIFSSLGSMSCSTPLNHQAPADAVMVQYQAIVKKIGVVGLKTVLKDAKTIAFFNTEDCINRIPLTFLPVLRENKLNEIILLCHFCPSLKETLMVFMDDQDAFNPIAPLVFATQRGFNETVKFLIAAGAPVDVKDAKGSSLLMIAMNKGYDDLTSYFSKLYTEKYPALHHVKNTSGETAISIAQEVKERPGTPPEKKSETKQQSKSAKLAHQKKRLAIIPLDIRNVISYDSMIDDFLAACKAKESKNKAELLLSKANFKPYIQAAFYFALFEKNEEAFRLLCTKFPEASKELQILFSLAVNYYHPWATKIILEYKKNMPMHSPQLITDLNEAIRRGHEDIAEMIIDEIIRRKININAYDANGITPLICAAIYGSGKIVKKLLDNNADAKIRDRNNQETPLMLAATENNIPAAQLLIPHSEIDAVGGPDAKTAFISACDSGHLEMARLLKDKGAKTHAQCKKGQTGLIKAIGQGHLKIVQEFGTRENLIVSTVDKRTALMFAACEGKELLTAVLQQLTIAHVNARNSKLQNALHNAVIHKRLDNVRLLIDANIDCNNVDVAGATALHHAADRDGTEEIIKLLLAHTKIVADKKGRTPLLVASQRGGLEAVQLLATSQTPAEQLNAQDDTGKTALIHAATQGYDEIVTHLLTLPNIDIKHADKKGKTARDYCAQKYPSIRRKLEKKMATTPSKKSPRSDPIPTDLGLAVTAESEYFAGLREKLKRNSPISRADMELLIHNDHRLTRTTRALFKQLLERIDSYERPEPAMPSISGGADRQSQEEIKEDECTSAAAVLDAAPLHAKPTTTKRIAKALKPYLSPAFLPKITKNGADSERRALDRLNQRWGESKPAAAFDDEYEAKNSQSVARRPYESPAEDMPALPKGTMHVHGDHLSLKFNLDHIFRGSRDETGRYSGLHHDYNRRLEKRNYLHTITAHPNGCYTARIGAEEKSFFPADWNPNEVIDRIIQGYDSGDIKYEQDPVTGNHIVHFTIENPGVDLRVNQILVRLIFNKMGTRIISVYPVLVLT